MKSNYSAAGPGTAVTVSIFALVLVFVAAFSGACGVQKNGAKSKAPPETPVAPAPSANENPVPASLVDAGEFGENIYDAAKTGDWKTANAKLAELNTAAVEVANAATGSQSFEETLKKLGKAVRNKKMRETLVESNLITMEIADLTSTYKSAVPVGVTKLDFYGRELEIWSSAKNESRLKETAAKIRETWNVVRPKVEKAGGTKQADVFESLVADLEKAKTPEEFGKSATPILDEVDNLEKVFE